MIRLIGTRWKYSDVWSRGVLIRRVPVGNAVYRLIGEKLNTALLGSDKMIVARRHAALQSFFLPASQNSNFSLMSKKNSMRFEKCGKSIQLIFIKLDTFVNCDRRSRIHSRPNMGSG